MRKSLPSICAVAILIILNSAIVFAKPKPVKAPALPARMSIQEMDSRASQLEQEIANLTAKVDQLRQDSVRAVSDWSRMESLQRANVIAADTAVARKATEISGTRAQRDRARRDSVSAYAAYKQKESSLQREAAALQLKISSVNRDLQSLSAKRDAVLRDDGSAGERALASLQTQLSQTDASLGQRQTTLADLGKQRDKLRQDSLAAEANLADARKRSAVAGHRVDSLIGLYAGATDQVNQNLAKARADSAAAQQKENEKVLVLSGQKTQAESRIASLKREQVSMVSERDRLRSTAGAAQQKYDQDRAPIKTSLANAETGIQGWNKEKDAWVKVKEKIALDGDISKVRNELDKAIEEAAMNKKGAKKVVEDKENQLNDLMRQINDYERNAQVMQKDREMAGLSLDQKRRRSDSLASSADVQLNAWVNEKLRSEKALADFDRANPAANSPALQRMAQLDTMASAKDKEIQVETSRIDSLNRQITTIRNLMTNMAASARSTISQVDQQTASYKSYNADLQNQRMKAKSDSLQAESVPAASLRQAKSDLSGVLSRIASTERDIASLKSTREQTARSITDTQARNQQAKTANATEKTRLDSEIASKQQELSSLNGQLEKTSRENQAAMAEFETTKQRTQPVNSQIDALIATQERDRIMLSRQRDSLSRDMKMSSQSMADRVGSIKQDLIGAKSDISTKQMTVRQIKMQRQAAVKDLESEVSRLDKSINAASQELSSLQAQRQEAAGKLAAVQNQPASATYKPTTAPTSSYSSPQLPAAYTSPAPAPAMAPLPPPPPPPASSTQSPTEQAQRILEQIYNDLSSNRMNEAISTFRSQRAILSRSLDPEVFSGLESTINSMAPSTGKKK
jgi:chromosome segregation ATPase